MLTSTTSKCSNFQKPSSYKNEALLRCCKLTTETVTHTEALVIFSSSTQNSQQKTSKQKTSKQKTNPAISSTVLVDGIILSTTSSGFDDVFNVSHLARKEWQAGNSSYSKTVAQILEMVQAHFLDMRSSNPWTCFVGDLLQMVLLEQGGWNR